eukprot:2046983-Rhodomonas_salina.2
MSGTDLGYGPTRSPSSPLASSRTSESLVLPRYCLRTHTASAYAHMWYLPTHTCSICLRAHAVSAYACAYYAVHSCLAYLSTHTALYCVWTRGRGIRYGAMGLRLSIRYGAIRRR